MNPITGGAATITLAITLALSVGCHDDRPTYEEQRPPTDSLVDGNTGIQAKDVGAATDRMATDLLALPALNASPHQWTVVLTSVQNNTTDPTMTYGVFDARLKSRLAQMGQGRVALIENKSTYHDLQNKELEGGTDAFGQGGAGGNPAGVQPDYALYITIDQMPNRATDYFTITAQLTGLRTRQIVWTSPLYEFQSAR
jgi:hypothetical protein